MAPEVQEENKAEWTSVIEREDLNTDIQFKSVEREMPKRGGGSNGVLGHVGGLTEKCESQI